MSESVFVLLFLSFSVAVLSAFGQEIGPDNAKNGFCAKRAVQSHFYITKRTPIKLFSEGFLFSFRPPQAKLGKHNCCNAGIGRDGPPRTDAAHHSRTDCRATQTKPHVTSYIAFLFCHIHYLNAHCRLYTYTYFGLDRALRGSHWVTVGRWVRGGGLGNRGGKIRSWSDFSPGLFEISHLLDVLRFPWMFPTLSDIFRDFP